jgi:hypothetical protein
MDGRESLQEMLRALRVEADSRRGIDGGQRAELFGGRRVAAEGGSSTYRFLTRTSRHRVRLGEAVHLLAHDNETLAVVVAVGEQGWLEVSVEVDLGLTVPFATLVRDDSYLIQALRERLRSARRGRFSFNWELVGDLLHPARWSSREPTGDVASRPRLNSEQAAAITAMAREGVTVIWGPPGTGKTRTLAVGVHRAWLQSKTILLLAHTNVAVDGLVERLLDVIGPERLGDGAIVRIGELASQSLRSRFGDRIDFDAIVERRREPLDRALVGLGGKISHARATLARLVEDGADEMATSVVRDDLERLEADAHGLERDHERTPAAVIEDARIVATTIHRAYLPGYLRRQFDVVVVDEASVVPLPMAVYAAGLATESVVFAGDPRQLGCIVQSRDPAVRRWVAATVFQPPRHGGNSRPRPILLREQYRMREEIAHLVNHISYRPGTLVTSSAVGRRTGPALPFLPSPVCYVDTSSLKVEASVPRGTHTRVNEVHARLAAAVIERISAAEANTTAAVITPYWGQARRIRRYLSPHHRSWVCVDTVHRFQGDERPVVVLDLPDAQGAPLSRFMRARDALDDGARLLTVGLSRSQYYLIVLADFEFLSRFCPRGAFVRRLVAYLQAEASPIPFAGMSPNFDMDTPRRKVS